MAANAAFFDKERTSGRRIAYAFDDFVCGFISLRSLFSVACNEKGCGDNACDTTFERFWIEIVVSLIPSLFIHTLIYHVGLFTN